MSAKTKLEFKVSGHVVTTSFYYHGDVVEDAGGLLTAAAVE